MEHSPHKRRAIITGASSGIGKATALIFAKTGIDVCLISRTEAKLADVAQQASEFGVKVKIVSLDLAEIDQVKTTIEAIAKEFQPIDILVNNAGVGYTNPLRETPLEDWEKVLKINLTSVFQCTLGVLPQMRERGEGTIVNVASIAANAPFPDWGAYCVSKSALVTFAQCLALEERANGIRVTTILPGAVNTPIWDTDTVNADLNREAMLTPEIVAQTILQTVLLPKEVVIENLTITPSIGKL